MNHHPDSHLHIHAARAADLQARARARELNRSAAPETWGRSGMLVRTRLGWLLVEAGLRLLYQSARRPGHPAT